METTGKKLGKQNAKLRAEVKKLRLALQKCKQTEKNRTRLLQVQVAEHKNTEKILRELEYRYHSLFRRMSEGFALCEVVFDGENEPSDLRLLEVNPAIEQLCGIKRSNLVGKTIREVIPQSRLGWIKSCGRVGLDGKPVHFERFSDHFHRHFEVSAYSPSPGKVACLFRDITHRKEAEKALSEVQERLQLALDSTELGTFDFEPATGKLLWSKFAWHHFSLSPGEKATLEAFLRPVHPDDRPRMERLLTEVFKPENPGFYTAEYRAIGLTDRKERWISAKGRVFFDPEGKPVRFLGVLLDITRRKKMEQERHDLLSEFQRQRSLLAAIINQMPIGVTVAESPSGRILLTNNAASSIFGANVDYEQGLNCYQEIRATNKRGQPIESRSWPLARAIKTGHGVQEEQIHIRHQDGSVRVLSSGATPIIDHEKRVIAAVSLTTDITDHVRMQEALRESQDRLEQKINQRTDELSRANGTMRMISECDYALAHATDELGLIRTICRLIYNRRLYRGVAVGFAENDEAKSIRFVAGAGNNGANQGRMKISWADNKRGQSPASVALRTGRVTVSNDYEDRSVFSAWKGQATGARMLSSIALPLRDRGTAFGVLIIYVDDIAIFNDHQIALLTELADNLAFGIIALRNRRDRDEAMRILEEKTLQLQGLAHQLTRVAEEERRCLAQMLQEELQQNLVAARKQLLRACQSKTPEALRQQARKTDALLKQCLLTTHSLTAELSPSMLFDSDFAGALKWLGDHFQKNHGLAVKISSDNPILIQSEPLRLKLFNGVKELLSRTLKSSKTKQAHLRLSQNQGQIRISVNDQGPEFATATVTKQGGARSFGLGSLKEQISSIGELQIESAPGLGNQFTIIVPDSQAAPPPAIKPLQ